MKITLLILLTLFIGCVDRHTEMAQSSDMGKKIIIMTDTTNNAAAQIDYDIYLLKKKLSKRLTLYDLENSDDSLELRFWIEPAIFSPSQLYILKIVDTSYSLFHYIIYETHFDPDKDDYRTWDGFKNPRLDSIKLETLQPLNITWRNYIAQLGIDSLWNFPSQSALNGSFGGVDGISYSLELTDKERYKFIHYNNPIFHVEKEINHKRFLNLEDKLIGPVSHERMLIH